MVVKFDPQTKKILWFNAYQNKEESQNRLNETTIWLDSSMPKAESKNGYSPVYYLNDDMQSVRVEYELIQTEDLTQLDRMEAQLNKSQDELRQEGADMMMSELVKRGLMA